MEAFGWFKKEYEQAKNTPEFRQETISEIADMIIDYSETEQHPDPVARIYSAMKSVEAVLFRKMVELREDERCEK